MFLQLVMPPAGAPGPISTLSALTQQSVDSLFLYTPLQVSAIVETFWRNRYNAPSSPFSAWPQWITAALLAPTDPSLANPNVISGYTFPVPPAPFPLPGAGLAQWPAPLPSGGAFLAPDQLPGIALAGGTVQPTNWDHLIYAYLIENTRIFDIFAKVLETYAYGEQLETPSPAAQIFWRNMEYLLYGDGLPSTLWTTSSRIRKDEIANRQTVYNWMFGIDLSHAQELAREHPYRKPTAANRDFFPTFEAFAREVWGGIMNAKNFSGANPTDPVAVATAARRIYDMMATRRLNGNLSREEFRAVAVMSWLHLAVMYDSPAVVDLKATASSPEQRLAKVAERVGMTAHSKAKPLFDLAQPFSFLMQAIELGAFNDPAGAALLYNVIPPNNVAELNAEVVIDQYSLATGRDLKATAVLDRSLPRSVPPRSGVPVRTNGQGRGRPATLTS
jgi:hypothetical protein